MGNFTTVFSRPNPLTIERFLVAAKMGNFELRGLGHARPRFLRVTSKAGHLQLDFDGAADGTIHSKLVVAAGHMTVRVPEGVVMKALSQETTLGEIDTAGPLLLTPGERTDAEAGLVLDLPATLGRSELR